MPILYPGCLPPGALVHARQTDAPAPIWLTADPASLEFSADKPDRAVRWHGSGPIPAEARAAAANETGTLFLPAPARLQLESEVNGGLVLPDAIPAAEQVTFGLIFRPDEAAEPRTLLSLQVCGEGDYLFLSAEEGQLRLAQKSGNTEHTLPLADKDGGAVLLLCSLADGLARVSANGGPAVSARLEHIPTGQADLFIGCRNARAGLHKKLGRFSLTDVMVWPGQNLLARPNDPALNPAKSLWQLRRADAV